MFQQLPCGAHAPQGSFLFYYDKTNPLVTKIIRPGEAILPFGTSEVTASMVLSMIERSEHLDKWRLRKKMSRARWGEAKFPKGNMASWVFVMKAERAS